MKTDKDNSERIVRHLQREESPATKFTLDIWMIDDLNHGAKVLFACISEKSVRIHEGFMNAHKFLQGQTPEAVTIPIDEYRKKSFPDRLLKLF